MRNFGVLATMMMLAACSAPGLDASNAATEALPSLTNPCAAPAACPNLDPVHGLPYGGEIASCSVNVVVGGKRAACYYGLGPSSGTGVCAPAPATTSFYDPQPPAGYVVASSCDECVRLARVCF